MTDAGTPRFSSVLFVCTGNICRSPAAEIAIRHLLARTPGHGLGVASAGIHGVDGHAIDPPMADALERKWPGIDTSHRARTFRPEMADGLVVAMERHHAIDVIRRCPQARNRTIVIGTVQRPDFSWDDIPDLMTTRHNEEIADPYGQSHRRFRRCANDIVAAVEVLIERL